MLGGTPIAITNDMPEPARLSIIITWLWDPQDCEMIHKSKENPQDALHWHPVCYTTNGVPSVKIIVSFLQYVMLLVCNVVVVCSSVSYHGYSVKVRESRGEGQMFTLNAMKWYTIPIPYRLSNLKFFKSGFHRKGGFKIGILKSRS